MPDTEHVSDGELAGQRRQRLLQLAREAALDGRLEDASRYGEIAWKLTTRFTLGANAELKQRVCRGCHAYLLPSQTARTRLDGGKVTTTCLDCGRTRRIPLHGEEPTNSE